MAITTGEVRLGYVHLDKPYTMKPDNPAKYSVMVLVPKTDTATMANINQAIAEAKDIGINNKWNGTAPPRIPTPIHDGDGVKQTGEPYGPECKGHWVFTAYAQADRKPRIVDINLQDIIDPTEIYSGMYGRVSVNFYAYNYGGRKGIGCGLNHVQKTRDGEPLGGTGISAEEAFGNPAPAQQTANAVPGGAPTLDPITGEMIS